MRLNLIEGRPNQEVKQAVIAADVLADQFIAGYAMFAIEGLLRRQTGALGAELDAG